jgi:hypothetical protein
LVEDGRAVFGGAEAADVAVAHVIHIDEDKVGFARGCMGDYKGNNNKEFHSLFWEMKTTFGLTKTLLCCEGLGYYFQASLTSKSYG